MQRLGKILWRGWDAVGENLAGERERWALWAPVALGAGIAAYFSLPVEPPLWAGCGALAAGGAAHFLLRRRAALRLLALGLVLGALGFAAAELRTAMVSAPVLAGSLKGIQLWGRVREVEFLPTGRRLRLDQLTIEGVDRPPDQIRLRLALDYPEILPGDRVRMRATLGPPSRPVAPGSYDFRRDFFFDRVGAVGFGYGRVGVTTPMGRPGVLAHMLWAGFAELRARIERRILAGIPNREVAGVAVAFVTGSQSVVSKDVLGAMRDSGLAHLLSVSGLHIGLVAGILFFVCRAALALMPAVALRWPIKKWAAGLALLGAVFYTLLSGASVPVVRACLMAGIALVAIICDRQPVSMRLIAWAAVVVLLIWPESLVGPSFQLSFAAIIALTAMWEAISPGRRPETAAWRRGLRGLGDMILTSLVATLATAAFAIYHFNRVTGYGVLANMLAIPITGFWVMPFLILALLLMPFGLEHAALVPAGWGIEVILWTARTVAGWPGAVAVVRAMPPLGLALVSLGGLWLCLWQRPWRYAGLAAVAVGLASVFLVRPPDLLVAEDGRLVAVAEADGSLRLSSRRADRFAGQEWLRRAGQDQALPWDSETGSSSDPDGASRLDCSAEACRYRLADRELAIVRTPAGLASACASADLVISAVPEVPGCAAPVIDRRRLARDGAYAIWLGPEGITLRSVREVQGARPWAEVTGVPGPGVPGPGANQ
jgi:competence protein ComEC